MLYDAHVRRCVYTYANSREELYDVTRTHDEWRNVRKTKNDIYIYISRYIYINDMYIYIYIYHVGRIYIYSTEGSWDNYRKNLNCRIERKKNRRESKNKKKI